MSDLDRLFAALADGRKAVQRPAAEALAARLRTEPALRARVAALLEGDDPRLRWGAAYVLATAEPAPDDAVPTLLEVLSVTDGDLRWASANLLVRMARRLHGVVERLRALVREAPPLGRKMALYCLRDLGARDAGVEGEVEAALADTEAPVRLAALSALAVLASDRERAAARMTALVDDPDAGVRRAAAATLGRMEVDAPMVRAVLARAAASDDEPLRRAASAALNRLDACAARRG